MPRFRDTQFAVHHFFQDFPQITFECDFFIHLTLPELVLSQARWKDVKVGDIVRVLKGQELPADVIQLASSEAQVYHICHVF